MEHNPETLAVHAGDFPVPVNAASSPPLFQASSYEFADLDEVEAIYAGNRPGAIYGRYGGPNSAHFASAIAELEGAEAAMATASGMAAIDAALATSAPPGSTILVAEVLYGGTYSLLENDYRKTHNVVAVDVHDPDAVAAAIQTHRPSVVHLETLSNPLIRVADIPAIGALARDAGATTIVDATFTTPVLARPLAWGADLVVHSVGKYLGGHGDVGAGVVSGSAKRIAQISAYAVRRGSTIAHFEAWLALRGVRTLALRMERHSANAVALAAMLVARPDVAVVHHPSLPDHPDHALATQLYPHGTGGMLAFDLHGGRAAVDTFTRALQTIAIVHSLGEVATTISYSAASSHRPLPEHERERLGVTAGTLRLSCGIEAAADLIADCERAFAALEATGLSANGRA